MSGGSSETSNPYLARLRDRHVPFLEQLGIRVVDASHGRAVFQMTVAEQHLRTLGILHGGVAATLLDTATGYAAVTIAPDDQFPITAQLNVNYIRPAWKDETLVATGEVRHAGRQTVVAYGEIRNAEDVLIASGTATLLFQPRPAGESLERRPDK